MKRPAFFVLLAPTGTDPDTLADEDAETHHVVVNAADQLRAELEAATLKLNVGKGMGMHVTMLWLWAALVRTKRFDGRFPEFRNRVLTFEPDEEREAPHTDDDETPDELDAHPTGASTG